MTGTIPEDLSFGLNVVFDISHNQFSGTIPENLATEIIPNVRHLHLDHNSFTGSIPGTFRELGKGRLRYVNTAPIVESLRPRNKTTDQSVFLF